MLQVESVTKEYSTPSGPLRILDGVKLTLKAGEAASIMGPSGSGKSTLLSILGALDPPTSGTFKLDGKNPFTLGEPDLAAFRNERIGFVFQDHCLLPQCTALENVLIPTLVSKNSGNVEDRARQLLDRVGLGERLNHFPSQLSGGEKQRVAIARALIERPALMLCDEPTGNLDRKSADAVSELLLELREQQQNILIVVTHSEKLAEKLPQRFELLDGKLVRR